MGITTDSLRRLQRVSTLVGETKGLKMLELGCQNIYDNEVCGNRYGMIAKDFFEEQGFEHTSVDICGCQKSIKLDLRQPHNLGLFDIVTDYGTTEHVEGRVGYYEAFKNIHNACKVGGLMIHETPKTGHWLGHGHNYVTEEFYKGLCSKTGYKIIELGEHFAMGNIADGGLIVCVLQKMVDNEFIAKESFLELDFRKS